MNRRERRQLQALHKENYPRLLEQRVAALEEANRELRQDYNKLVAHANFQAQTIQEVRASGQLVYQLDESLTANEPVVAVSTHAAVRDRLNAYIRSQRDFLWAFGELRVLMTKIDAIATMRPVGAVAKDLKGLDVRLQAQMTLCTGYYRELEDTPTEAWVTISKFVARRTDAIQKARRDGGDRLRRVVIETSSEFSALAEEIINKARQGRRVETRTQRIYEYGQTFYYAAQAGDKSIDWNDAARRLYRHLLQNRNQLDNDDKTFLDNLEAAYQNSGYAQMGEWFRTRYHNAAKTVEKLPV